MAFIQGRYQSGLARHRRSDIRLAGMSPATR